MSAQPNPTRNRHTPIGAILVEEGVITDEQLQSALEYKKSTGVKLGQALVALKHVTHAQLAAALERQGKIQCIQLTKGIIDLQVARALGDERSRSLHAVAINRIADTTTVALEDPADVYILDEITRALDSRVLAVHAEPGEIQAALDHVFSMRLGGSMLGGMTSGPGKSIPAPKSTGGKSSKSDSGKMKIAPPPTPTDSLDDIVTFAHEESEDSEDESPSLSELAVTNEDNPVIKVVNRIITEAYETGASDIHIEPQEKKLSVRFRVDGSLYERTALPPEWNRMVIARLKVMSELDISQRRLPQDGRIRMMLDGNRVDFRLATTPTLFGEGAVIRILAGATANLTLDNIGFEKSQLDVIYQCASAKDGFFLVTGPTGSGKTTTLYAVLSHLNSPDRKIITLEDPVENQLDGATQINANPKVGMTFAVGLRSILRQDPDVLLVGEIRDEETAEIACHAALTGHLVLSTLHTVGTAETITRLTEMNVEAYLLADTVRGIIAQRLVRRICKNCKEEHRPEKELLERLRVENPDATFFKGRGCDVCNGTGFKGRVGVYEIMRVDTNVASAVRKGLRSDAIQEAAQESGMITLREDGLRKAMDGQTPLSEVLAVTPRD